MHDRISIFISSVAIGIVFAGAALTLVGSEARAKMAPVEAVTVMSNAQLMQIRSDLERTTNPSPKDIERAETSVRQLMKENKLSSPQDFYNASRIFSKGASIDSALSAHETALVCLSMGDSRAKSIAALTEDQILVRLGSKQRFGTQMGTNHKLSPVCEGVTDGVRNLLGLPSIITANRLATQNRLNQRFLVNIEPEVAPMAVSAE